MYIFLPNLPEIVKNGRMYRIIDVDAVVDGSGSTTARAQYRV